MYILQHAIRGPVNRIAEIGLEPVVPRGFQITDLQITGHQSALQIKPQEHVEIVLQLVGLGPDIAVRDTVHDAVEGFFIHHAKITEGIAHLTIQPAGKGTAAPKLVFIDPALTFVDPHRHPRPKRRQKVVLVDALLVAGMPDLVDGGIETVERVQLVGACGDPHIKPGPA